MPFSIPPSVVKTLLPTPSSGQCSSFKKLINYPSVLDALVSYFFDESGFPSTQFQADLCATECCGAGSGGGNPNPSMPAPTLTSASDGSLPDSVDLDWTAVVPSGGTTGLKYRVYRLATEDPNADPTTASAIATVNAPTIEYNDATVVIGTTYRYWIKSFNATLESSFSNGDFGHAGEVTSDLDAITDLTTIPGRNNAINTLFWTAPTGATHYDVYRGATSVFADSTLLRSDVVPKTTQSISPTDIFAPFWDNGDGKLLFVDQTEDVVDGQWWYWVVAKKNSPPAVSLESNAVFGWCTLATPSEFGLGNQILTFADRSFVIPSGVTTMYVVVVGGGASGAGGSETFGGGGGSGPGTVTEEFTVAPTDTIEIEFDPDQEDTSTTPRETDGEDGSSTTLLINTVSKVIADGGHGGIYNPAGGGTGGAGENGTGDVAPTIYTGLSGKAASGATGGQSGASAGDRRLPSNYPPEYYGEGSSAKPGSGASAYPINADLSIGGKGGAGFAILYLGA